MIMTCSSTQIESAGAEPGIKKNDLMASLCSQLTVCIEVVERESIQEASNHSSYLAASNTMRRTLTKMLLMKAFLLQRVDLFSINRIVYQCSTMHFIRQFDSNRIQSSPAARHVLFSNRIDVKPDSEIFQSTFIPSLRKLCSAGSDIRGRFVPHDESISSLVEAIQESETISNQPPLTPFAAYCIGHAFANTIIDSFPTSKNCTICIGVDPRTHGVHLAEAFACGIESDLTSGKNDQRLIKAVFTGAATTPACASFVRSQQCDGSVMVTASHLPRDRNGFKLFSAIAPSGFSKGQIREIGVLAESFAMECLEKTNLLSFSSLEVKSALHVDWMPFYADTLRNAILTKTHGVVPNNTKPLTGLKLILNSGNGAGGFFQAVLEHLGADVSASLHIQPDGSFPNGIPNPEDVKMLEQTLSACEREQADLGIMLDTDADRCGFVAPRTINDDTGIRSDYEALNRNRLIALLGVIFAKEKPGCAVVTDSVTSEGLSDFLNEKLGLQHIRYIKGYANVIGKARELTTSGEVNAELAIETSGHCAMRENGYLDDGTYTAVKIISLLAQQRAADISTGQASTLLDLICDMSELDEVSELRMTTKDASLDTMQVVFAAYMSAIEQFCLSNDTWQLDRENLEGIRIRFGSDGEFFMLRKSLHDPIISLQIEAQSKQQARELVVQPLIKLLESNYSIYSALNMDVVHNY